MIENDINLPQKRTSFEPQTNIAQPNSVTFAHASFSRTQIQIFAYIMKELQGFVTPQLAALKTRDMNALQAVQLSLFIEVGDSYLIDIPKKLFVKSANYKRFQQELTALSTLPIRYKKRNPKSGKVADYHTNIFSLYDDTDSNNRSVTVEIKKDTLQVLCFISTVAEPRDALYYLDYYTNYTFEVLTSFSKKYTCQLYLYLSSWKSKGGWKVLTSELRSWLVVQGNKYVENKDFKKHVLYVASDEMRQKKAPFWFEASFSGDYTVFKIITQELVDGAEMHKNNIIDLLKRSFGCSHEQINSIRSILDTGNFDKLREIILDCSEAVNDKKREDPVNDPAKFVVGAIKRWYRNYKRKISS